MILYLIVVTKIGIIFNTTKAYFKNFFIFV